MIDEKKYDECCGAYDSDSGCCPFTDDDDSEQKEEGHG